MMLLFNEFQHQFLVSRMGDGVASFFNRVRYWTTMGMSTQFSGELLAVAENRLTRALSFEPDAANTDEGRNDNHVQYTGKNER